MTPTAEVRVLPRVHRGPAAIAALGSVVTMPLTAMWFLLIGGVLLATGLVAAIARGTTDLGAAASVGLGLLAGPAIYLGLALLQ